MAAGRAPRAARGGGWDEGCSGRGARLRGARLPCYAPLGPPTYDPFGPLPGYCPNPQDPVGSRLEESLYPVLELCIDAFYVSLSRSFQGPIEFVHHVEAVQHFIRDGANVEVKDDNTGATSLHFAAGSGALQICRVLLHAKARPCARDRRLQTPLWWGMHGRHLDVCRLLVKHDKATARLVDIDRMSPLHEAARIGCPEMVGLLLPFYKRPGPDIRGRALRTPLHIASKQGHNAVCTMLVEARADPQRACSRGKTALHHAAEKGVDNLELCHYFVEHRPMTRRLRSATGDTPRDSAARHARLSPAMNKVLFNSHHRVSGGCSCCCRHLRADQSCLDNALSIAHESRK